MYLVDRRQRREIKICLPQQMRRVLLRHMHCSKVAGHMGILIKIIKSLNIKLLLAEKALINSSQSDGV